MSYEPIRIYTAQDNVQAEMILTALENNGIPAYKKDLGNAGLMNLYGGNSFGGAEIYVADANKERAAEVLIAMGLA